MTIAADAAGKLFAKTLKAFTNRDWARLIGTSLFNPSAPVAPNETADATLIQKLMALGVQLVVMGVMEMILIQSDAKAQAMIGVGLSAFLSVLAAYVFM